MALLVNDEYVDDASIRQEADLLRAQLSEAMAGEDPLHIALRAREWARENVIERVLLRQAACEDPAPIPPDAILRALEQLRAQPPGRTGQILVGSEAEIRAQVETGLRVERLMARIAQSVEPPTRREIAEHYRRHHESFYLPELVHAAHIVKNVTEAVDEAVASQAVAAAQEELRKGRPFEEVADEFSDCPGRGGDLGFFARGQMVDEFEDAAFNLPAGGVSEVIRTPFGFHIVKVYEKRPPGIPPLAEVRERIERLLFDERREQALAHFLSALRARSTIVKAPPASKAGAGA